MAALDLRMIVAAVAATLILTTIGIAVAYRAPRAEAKREVDLLRRIGALPPEDVQ